MSAERVVRQRKRHVGWLVTAVLAILYAPVVRDLVIAWSDSSYHAYGFVIAPFSAWLVWESRRRLATAPFVGWRPGLAVVAAGLLIAVLGTAAFADSLVLRAVSLPIVLAGIGTFALGRDGFRPFAFPVGFLVLMTPLPPSAIAALSLPMQHLAAAFTAIALRAVGVPATRDGLFVVLPTVTLHVEEWCNGLRFLLAMFVVGIAFGWLAVRALPHRLLVVALALVVGLTANLLRVAGTGAVAHFVGREAATGTPHLVYGKLVYLVMMGSFVAAVIRLRRSQRQVATAVAR